MVILSHTHLQAAHVLGTQYIFSHPTVYITLLSCYELILNLAYLTPRL